MKRATGMNYRGLHSEHLGTRKDCPDCVVLISGTEAVLYLSIVGNFCQLDIQNTFSL